MKTAEFLIVGGGAAGLTVAAELSVHASVILLEAEAQAGYHASGRSAAVFVPSYGHGLLRELTRLSRPAFDTPAEQFFPTPLLSKRGLLRLVLEGGEAQHAKTIEGRAGIDLISPEEATRRFPIMPSENMVSASYEDDVHDIDSNALLQGSVRKAKANGAEIYFSTSVTKLTRNNGVWTVQTNGEDFQATTIINAAGAWANQISEMAHLSPIELLPCRRSFAVLPLPSQLGESSQIPFTVTSPLRWYAKPEGGRLLISPADEDLVEPHDVFADDMVIAEGLQRFEEDTGFPVTRVEQTMAGIRTVTPDEYPVVGFDPRIEGFFWLAGQCGFGIQCAPGLAKLACDLLVGRNEHPALSEAFGIERMCNHQQNKLEIWLVQIEQ